MPTYTYECPCCGAEFDRVMPAAEYKSCVPCDCGGGSALRIFKPATAANVYAFKPWTTYHVTGERMEINTPKQERDMENRHHVAVVGKADDYTVKRPKRKVSDRSFAEDFAMTKQRLGLR